MSVEEVVTFSADAGDESDVEMGAGRGRDVSLRMRAVTSSWNEDDARKALCASKVSRTVIYEVHQLCMAILEHFERISKTHQGPP